ncbi:MAG: hypothetical protein AB1445_09335 [Bacillota bacterium]
MDKDIDNQGVKRQARPAGDEREPTEDLVEAGDPEYEDDEEYLDDDEEYEDEEYDEDDEYDYEDDEPAPEPPKKARFRLGRWDVIFIVLGAVLGIAMRSCSR